MSYYKNDIKNVRNKTKHYEKAIEGDKEIAIEFMGAKNKHRKGKALYHARAMYPLFLSIVLSCGLGTIYTRTVSKRNLSTVEKTDTLGNNTSISRYTSEYDNSANKLSHFLKWELNENNEYVRTVETYNTNNYNSEVIKNILANADAMYSLEDMFGKPIYTYNETAKTLSEEELNKPEYIEAVTYTKDKDDYIITKMDTSDAVPLGILFAVITVGVTTVYNLVRSDYWDYEEALLKVEKSYCEDLEILDEKVKTLKKTP